MDNVADKSTKFNKSTFLISFSIFFSLSYFFALSFLIVYIYYSLYPISTFTYILLRFILPVHLCIPLSISRLCNNIYPSLRLLDTMLLIFFLFSSISDRSSWRVSRHVLTDHHVLKLIREEKGKYVIAGREK